MLTELSSAGPEHEVVWQTDNLKTVTMETKGLIYHNHMSL